jgi:ABC-type glycerol-3-phosphate transport system substrate-binding protein
MDKRFIIIGVGVLLIIVLGIILLTSGKTTKKTSSNTDLVIWDSFDNKDSFDEMIQSFENQNPKIKVQYVKKNPATYENDSVNAIANGNGPDIWIVPSNWMPKHHEKMATMPEKTLDPNGKETNAATYKDKYVAVAYQDNVIDNQVYGIPLFMDSLSLFYNQDLIGQKYDAYVQSHPNADLSSIKPLFDNPPTTWGDLTNLIKYYGPNAIALGATNVENSSDILTAIMLQYGAQMNSDDKASALFHTSTSTNGYTPYPGAKALTFFTSFARSGDPNFTWSKDEKSAYDDFVKGKVAMMISYSQIQAQLTKDMSNRFQVSAIPQTNKSSDPIDLAYYQVLTVPKNATNSQAAWSFINYLTNDQNQADVGYFTTTHLASPKLASIKNSSNALDVQNKFASSWYNPDPAKVNDIFKNAISQALDGQNPQTVIEGAAAQVTTLLANLKGLK